MSYVTIPVRWGSQVRDARLALGMTAERLATKAGISITTLRRIETAAAPVRCQDTKWASLLRSCALYRAWTKEASVAEGRAAPGFAPAPSEPVNADVFLAVAMDSLLGSYSSTHELNSMLLATLRDDLGLTVSFPAESRLSRGDFEDEAWALADNCRALDAARSLLVIYPPPLPNHGKPLASSILIEVGYAIARGIPTLVFYSDSRDTLPFLLRSADAALPSFRLVRYRTIGDIVSAVLERERAFFDSVRMTVAGATRAHSLGAAIRSAQRDA